MDINKGIIIQYAFNDSNSGSFKTFTYPIAFTARACPIVQNYWTSDSYDIGVTDSTTTQFFTNKLGNRVRYWIAIGY